MIRPAIALALTLATPASAADMVLGGMLFEENCLTCHGETGADGDSGDIRGLDLGTVRRALRGFEEMAEFEFEDHEIEAIVAWLSAKQGVPARKTDGME